MTATNGASLRLARPTQIGRDNILYPDLVRTRLGGVAPSCLYAMGETAILGNRFLGLLCSVQCPGSVIIKTFDAIRLLRDKGAAVIGGFHSPMERECLDILLRGRQPVVLCPAKRLKGLRLGEVARHAVRDGRMLVISPFDESVRRTTAPQAVLRNDLAAALSEALLVPHAAPGGKTWTTIRAALDRQQPVFTFAVQDNAALLEAGATAFGELDITCLRRTPRR